MTSRRLDEEEIAAALEGLGWTRQGDAIAKVVTLEDFSSALAWVNRVGALAEERDHHPDITISWNKVTLRLTTHSSGGLTALDFDLANAVDEIAP
jgi:4a-hydroxytetrahydrobiopterin dehydratase